MKKLLFIALIMFAACKKAPLEVDSVFDIPEDQAINNINDLEVLVNGAYQSLQARNNYGAALKLIPDLLSDQVVITTRAYQRNTGDYFNLYTRQFFGTADGVWRECYTCINRCNAVLNAIEKGTIKASSQVETDNLTRIQGEALFLRAMMHFELVRLYGLQYGLNQDETQSGVLLKLTLTTGRYSQPRATTREVYEAIQKDLIQAIGLLPDDRRPTDLTTYGGRVGGRATKPAAQAILARVYFQKATEADDQLALEQINAVLANPAFDVAADTIGTQGFQFLVKTNYTIHSSVLFQVVNIINPFTNEGNSTAKPLIDSYFPEDETSDFPTIYALSSIFVDSIKSKSKSTDSRVGNGIQGSSVPFTTKYRTNGASVDLNIPVIRASELVISRAEILATLGRRDEAIADVLQLRKRAYSNFVESVEKASLEALSNEGLVREIARERSTELFTEGDRLHHFRRFAQRHRLSGTLSMGTARSSYRIENSLDFDKKRFLFQIPDAEIAANPAVARN